MGFNTEYLGHLEITPHLNAAEVQWLSGFADWGGLPDGDPFTLPMNPRAELTGASAQQSGNPDFAEFTFDHRLDGVIAGVRDDTDELFLLRVVNSEITWETVVPGVDPW